ncbi:hypothetical protein KYN89_02400 [Alteriqipengyuania sp. NZ-12B]|uniref:HK97 gp10 family phage protein n=1 Tax=Alteriqipengyuania abyssalis TaxID=2860200 RepID=A0ABS7PA73_9SPHN|nr:hypothetical protein [Alteriqipengyuania abyssalis]MBY8335891.1 hypothetical protein [Alteriqipengyuania abyssalis]
MELKDIGFGLGSITFHSKEDDVPDKSEVQGNVTINTVGRAGKPAHFTVSNHIACQFERDGIQTHEYFNWGVVVTGFDASATYKEVELAAAEQLAPMLRAVADRIEASLEEAAKKASEGNA